MTAQDNIALARSLIDPCNSHQSGDPAWLEKSLASFTHDETPQSLMFPRGGRFLVQMATSSYYCFSQRPSLLQQRSSWTTAFAAEDQLVIEFTGGGGLTPAHCICLQGDIPATGRYSEL